jgi:glycosyltransferase involved in cell wall biosynthesis
MDEEDSRTFMISGYTIVHNALKGDYCIRECIESLLPICDEVIVGDASDDGTREMLERWSVIEPKVRVIRQEWKQPHGEPTWFVKWINETRKELRHPYQMMLDADEVLDERAYPVVLDAAKRNVPLWFERLNFEINARTVIPKGECCGNLVVRCGPTSMWMPSDEPYPSHAEEPEIRKIAELHDSPPLIHHYGFLRKDKAMFEKCRVNLKAFFGGYDDRLTKAEAEGKPWHHYVVHKNPYLKYTGPHPKHCIPWLIERGAL